MPTRIFSLIAAFLLAAMVLRAEQLLPTAPGTSWQYDSKEVFGGPSADRPVESIVTIRASTQLFEKKEFVKFETFSGYALTGTGFVKEIAAVRGPNGGLLQRVTRELRKAPELSASPPPTATPASTTPVPQPSAPPATPDANQSPSKKLTVEVSGDPGGGLKTEFKSDAPNIYVRWHGHDLPERATVRVAWVAEDVGDLVDPNFIIDQTESVAPTPDASARFTLGRPPDGWAEGKYRLEFYVNDELVETIKVTIAK